MLPASLIAALAAAAAVAGPDPAVASVCPAAEKVRPLAVTTLCLVNQARARNRIPPLRIDPRLVRAARRHSRDMVARGYFSHTSPQGLSSSERIARTGFMRGRRRWTVGENIAWRTGAANPGAIVRGWLASAAHRRVLLDRRFRVAGIGIASGTPRHGASGLTYTADFGS
jgi:uncharacterized protein YkwD